RTAADEAAELLDTSAALRPVNEAGAEAQPFGLFHPYGNADEVTSTFARYPKDGVLVHHPTERYVLGGAWDVRQRKVDLTSHNTSETEVAFFDRTLGLRLARSVRLP
ncbi:MAG: hypothetical protein AAFP86_17790, partial [Planctomycetota bacterium]